MAYYRDAEGKFGPEKDDFKDIFEEYDSSCPEAPCDFFCPECRYMLQCEAYTDIKESWESFYV